MSEINSRLFDYLRKKLPTFSITKKKNASLFTCPNVSQHKTNTNVSATCIAGSDKIACMMCGWKGTIYDCVRLLEPDKANKSDAAITEYLIADLSLDMYSELAFYEKYGWALLPIIKNTKKPFEDDWRNSEYKDKVQWIKWLNNGLNLGLNNNKSGTMQIDVDNKEAVKNLPAEIALLRNTLIQLCEDSKTLMQNTRSGGRHYIFKIDTDITQETNMGGTYIDTRTDKGQILIAPSNIDKQAYSWVNLGNEIKYITPELKAKLLEILKVEKSRNNASADSLPLIEGIPDSYPELKDNNLEGCCNDTFIKLGGMMIKQIQPKDVRFVLHLMNRYLLKNPMAPKDIEAMMSSLGGYQMSDEQSAKILIYDYLKQMQNDVTAKDIMESTKLPRAIVDKYLSEFVKDGKAIRLGRGRYKYRERIEWSDTFHYVANPYPYKIPYFDELMDYEHGDIILIGGIPGGGKTHQAMNFLNLMIKQNVKPYYIFSESGSRHFKIAKILGIDGKFFFKYHANPLSIEIEPESFTIIDWLNIEDKSETDMVFSFFTQEMQRKGGILVIFTQLKQDYSWFAPNMITQFPAVAARYIFESQDKRTGHWEFPKIRDSKVGSQDFLIHAEFDPTTRIITKKTNLI